MLNARGSSCAKVNHEAPNSEILPELDSQQGSFPRHEGTRRLFPSGSIWTAGQVVGGTVSRSFHYIVRKVYGAGPDLGGLQSRAEAM